MMSGGVARELILDLQSGLILRKVHSLCDMTSLIPMLPPDKSLQGTASRASTALSATWTLAIPRNFYYSPSQERRDNR